MKQNVVFTALHGILSDEMRILSVCLSVCLSVTRVNCDKMVEIAVLIYMPYERTLA